MLADLVFILSGGKYFLLLAGPVLNYNCPLNRNNGCDNRVVNVAYLHVSKTTERALGN